jgi:EAL domain-containing protein (putative c-di-GMP-specific phosphodiesterase class I)
MADAMGADIVAEGVEDKTQLHTLKSVNCHRAQGYLISPPVDVQDVPRVVREIEDPETWASRTN